MTESYDRYEIPYKAAGETAKLTNLLMHVNAASGYWGGNWYERSIKSGRLDISLWRVGRACSDDWAAPSERRYGNSHAGNLLLRAESVAYTTGG
jgi:hypothetical protein